LLGFHQVPLASLENPRKILIMKSLHKLTFVVVLLLFCLPSCAAPKMADDADLTEELNYLRAEAINMHLNACDANEAKSCSVVGNMYFKGEGVKQDFARAAKPLEKACNQGEIRSCTLLGLLYERGDGVAQNISQALAVYQKACHSGDPMSCKNLATLYEKELNGVKAVTFYQKACDDGDNSACEALMRNYRFTDK
jgi:TPR repeat protein